MFKLKVLQIVACVDGHLSSSNTSALDVDMFLTELKNNDVGHTKK